MSINIAAILSNHFQHLSRGECGNLHKCTNVDADACQTGIDINSQTA